MDIDVNKVLIKFKSNFELAAAANKLEQELMEALHIFQSTIKNWDDKECLELNKNRMIKYFNKFAKD